MCVCVVFGTAYLCTQAGLELSYVVEKNLELLISRSPLPTRSCGRSVLCCTLGLKLGGDLLGTEPRVSPAASILSLKGELQSLGFK